jgi:hypothetical protein
MESRDLEVGKKYLILKDSYGEKKFFEIEILKKANLAIKCFFEDDNQKIWYDYQDFNDIFKIVECLSDEIDMLVQMNLKWKDTEPKTMNWYQAKELESDGWVLPSLFQLKNAFDNKTEGFKSFSYWSCTESSGGVMAYHFNFLYGFNYTSMKTNSAFLVRLCKVEKYENKEQEQKIVQHETQTMKISLTQSVNTL